VRQITTARVEHPRSEQIEKGTFMSTKWIPNSDLEFLTKAESRAQTIAKDPALFEIEPEESLKLTEAVQRFRAAFQKARTGMRSQAATLAKDRRRRSCWTSPSDRLSRR
jgi:hypothetical protein